MFVKFELINNKMEMKMYVFYRYLFVYCFDGTLSESTSAPFEIR